jgi:hypothetical protein
MRFFAPVLILTVLTARVRDVESEVLCQGRDALTGAG